MKIAFILGTFFPKAGGVQVQIHNLANRLCKSGIDVKLFIYKKQEIKIITMKSLFLKNLYLTLFLYSNII